MFVVLLQSFSHSDEKAQDADLPSYCIVLFQDVLVLFGHEHPGTIPYNSHCTDLKVGCDAFSRSQCYTQQDP